MLRPARDLETGIEAVIGGLLGGHQKDQPPPGSIGSVVVAEDAPQRLTISVECTGNLQGRQFRGELLDGDHRYQRQFRTAPVRVEGDRCAADLTFEPKNGGAGGDLPVSEYVRVSVDGGGPALKRLFTLGKAWGGSGGVDGSSTGLAYVKVKGETGAQGRRASTVEPTPAPPPIHIVRRYHAPGEDGWCSVRHRRPTTGTARRRRPSITGTACPRPSIAPAWAPCGLDAGSGDPAARVSAAAQGHAGQDGRRAPGAPHSSASFTMQAQAFALTPTDVSRVRADPTWPTNSTSRPRSRPNPGVTPTQLLHIGTLFRDQDPATGYFYFVPEAYHLGWLRDQGRYDMTMLYLAATTPGSAGEVAMAAGLTSGIGSDEIQMVKAAAEGVLRSEGGVRPSS